MDSFAGDCKTRHEIKCRTRGRRDELRGRPTDPIGRVALAGERGTVVCSIDTDEYTNDFTAEHWRYLKKGVLIDFPKWGLIYFDEADQDLVLVVRG